MEVFFFLPRPELFSHLYPTNLYTQFLNKIYIDSHCYHYILSRKIKFIIPIIPSIVSHKGLS